MCVGGGGGEEEGEIRDSYFAFCVKVYGFSGF